MSTIVTRAAKGSALTFSEVDANFVNLNNDKYQAGASANLNSLELSIALSPSYGGTGQTSYLSGDMLYATGNVTLAKLPIGSLNQVLATASGGVPQWQTTTGTGSIVRANNATLTFPVLGQAAATSIGFPNGLIKTASLSSASTVADQIIESFDKTSYRSAKFQIQAVCGTAYHITELYVVHDDTTTYETEYGIIVTGGSLATFSTGVNGSWIELRATPANNNTTFKVVTTLISV